MPGDCYESYLMPIILHPAVPLEGKISAWLVDLTDQEAKTQ